MMTKKEVKLLTGILADMTKAERHILRDDIRFCMVTKNGNSVTINKHIGSELCYLYNAIDRLELMLNPPKEVDE